MSRLGLWTIPAALLVALASSAPATAGGGGGGVCFQDSPAVPAGWVAVLDSCFEPQTMTVSSGSAVRWEMFGQMPHTVTFDGGPDSGPLERTQFAIRFNEPGTYQYYCAYHPGMTGSIEVTGTAIAGAYPMELLDESGGAIEGSADTSGVTSEESTDVPAESTRPDIALAPVTQQHRIALDPLTGLVVLIVLFPLSMSAAMRLLGPSRRLATAPVRRMRLRLPFYVVQPEDEIAPPKARPRR